MKSKNQAYVYQLGIDGIYGRKLEKNGGENCEQPWLILIDKNTTQPLIEKKNKFIKILHEYNHKVIGNECDNENMSRLYNLNYRTICTNKVNIK